MRAWNTRKQLLKGTTLPETNIAHENPHPSGVDFPWLCYFQGGYTRWFCNEPCVTYVCINHFLLSGVRFWGFFLGEMSFPEEKIPHLPGCFSNKFPEETPKLPQGSLKKPRWFPLKTHPLYPLSLKAKPFFPCHNPGGSVSAGWLTGQVVKCKEQISERKSQLGKSTTGDEKLQELNPRKWAGRKSQTCCQQLSVKKKYPRIFCSPHGKKQRHLRHVVAWGGLIHFDSPMPLQSWNVGWIRNPTMLNLSSVHIPQPSKHHPGWC